MSYVNETYHFSKRTTPPDSELEVWDGLLPKPVKNEADNRGCRKDRPKKSKNKTKTPQGTKTQDILTVLMNVGVR